MSRAEVDFGSDQPLAWLVGQAQAKPGIDLSLVGGAGSSRDGEQIGERPDH